MPFSLFSFFKRKPKMDASSDTPSAQMPAPTPKIMPKTAAPELSGNTHETIRRHFFNERGFQTYASFFSHWGGWVTAGHVLDDCGSALPPFASGTVHKWPNGLDAALLGCKLPPECPAEPRAGLDVICTGFPAGSAHAAHRAAKVYIQRPGAQDVWIARILTPDEPVVSGMSGGLVYTAKGSVPLGIIITRNSPADLNNDRDPDESLDFVSLAGVWHALQGGFLTV